MRTRSVPAGSLQTIYIGKKAISLSQETVPLQSLRLDPDNPRLRRRVHSKFNGRRPTQKQLRDIILELPPVPDLQADIRENGGLLEPVYVTSDGRVVEGNCRTAVFLKLRDTFKSDSRWTKIPVLRFPSTVGEADIAIFQGKYHITSGKNPWEAYEKANHIYYMHHDLKMSVEAISKALAPRMHVDTVNRLLEAYSEFTESYLAGSKGKDSDVKAWSHFEEFFKRKDLAEFRKASGNRKKFSKLVKSGRLGRAENVRRLAKIVETPGAMEVLETKGIDDATKVLMKDDPAAGSPLFKVLAQALSALKKCEQSEIARIKKEIKQQNMIRELHSKLCSLADAADVDIGDHYA